MRWVAVAGLLGCSTPGPPPPAQLSMTVHPVADAIEAAPDSVANSVTDGAFSDVLSDVVPAKPDAGTAGDVAVPGDPGTSSDLMPSDVSASLPAMPVPTQPIGLQAWFGEGMDDRLHAVAVMPAGGYALVGRTLDAGAGAADGVVLRLDPCGNLLWAVTCGELHDDDLVALLPMGNGGVLVAGRTANNGLNEDMLVARLDALGQPQWSRALGGAEDDAAVALAQAPGGAAILGISSSFGGGAPPQWNVLLARLEESGAVAWTRAYWSAASTMPAGLVAVQGGNDGWLLLGSTLAATAGQHDAWLLRAAPDGMPLWTRTLGGLLDEQLLAGVTTADSGFLAVGRTRSFGALQEDMLLARLDGAGQVLWSTRLATAGFDEATAVWPHGTGFVLAGTTAGAGAGGADFVVQTIDSSGNSLHGVTFGGASDDVASGAAPTPDGGAILAGWRVNSTGGNTGVLVKTESPGASACAGNDLTLATVALGLTSQPQDSMTETSPALAVQPLKLVWTPLATDFAHVSCATPCP